MPARDLGLESLQLPRISVVVLAWDQLHHTQRCVTSVRDHTDVPYELIVVDNGSEPEAADFARRCSETAVMHATNLGFARGMNAGLEIARGDYVAFVNNDTVLPSGWASMLLSNFDAANGIGAVVPAVTSAGRDLTVRDAPGKDVRLIPPFDSWPSGVVVVMPTPLARELGGFSEEFGLASAEDADLAFKVWVNDLDVLFDERVLVEHASHGTSAAKLGRHRRRQWQRSRRLFLEKWADDSVSVPRSMSCSPERLARNRVVAASVARWILRHDAAYQTSMTRLWLVTKRLFRRVRTTLGRS